jgi:conjugation system TraG family ATPase
MKKLIDIQPLYKIEDDYIINKKGDITMAFHFSMPEIFTLSISEQEEALSAFEKMVMLMPEHTVIHKQDWFFNKTYNSGSNSSGDLSFLARAYEMQFNERAFMSHDCYIYFTKTSKVKKTSMDTIFSTGRLVPTEMLDRDKITAFVNSVEKAVHYLESTGFFKLKRIHADELTGSQNNIGLLEQYFTLSQKKTVCDINIDKNSLRVGNNICSFYSLSSVDDAPSNIATSILDPRFSTEQSKMHVSSGHGLGLGLKTEHIYNQYIFVENQEDRVREFEKKGKQLTSFSAYSRNNALNARLTNEYLQEAAEGKKVVRVHYNVMMWDENDEELRRKKVFTSSAFERMGCFPKINTLDLGNLYWAGVPGNGSEIPFDQTFFTFTNQASCFCNLETNAVNSSSDYGIKLCDRESHVPLLVDFTEEPMNKIIFNRNKYIIGGSGAGKSFFTNHLMRNYYDQGSHVLIVDVGNSYKKLCNLTGGVFFEYTDENKLAFNPFYKPNGVTEDNIETIKTLVATLWRKSAEFTEEEEAIMRVAITNYYSFLGEHPDIFPCFNTFYEFILYIESLTWGEDNRTKYFDKDSFKIVLSQFYKGGIYDFLLNSTENLDLMNQRFIVFELDSIKNNRILFSVVTFMIMDIYIDKLFHIKGCKRTILIEEAWKAIANSGMASFMKYLYKTVRKHNGEAIIVTQEVDDIVGNEVVKNSILNNADCKILLDLRKFMNMFDTLQHLLGLTEKEKAMVLSLNRNNDPKLKYREVFIGMSTIGKVYAYEPSPIEYGAYTTEKKESDKIFEYTKKFNGDMKMGIRQFSEDLVTAK